MRAIFVIKMFNENKFEKLHTFNFKHNIISGETFSNVILNLISSTNPSERLYE